MNAPALDPVPVGKPGPKRARPLLLFALMTPLIGGCVALQAPVKRPESMTPLSAHAAVRSIPSPFSPMPASSKTSRANPVDLGTAAATTATQAAPTQVNDPSVLAAAATSGVAPVIKPVQAEPNRTAIAPDVPRDDIANLAGETPLSIPQATPPQAIDLPAALRLANSANPAIGEARVLILAALAQRQNAYAILLPTLNAGTNYHDHVGVLQRSNGTILPVTEQSLYFGGGARTVAAESVGIPAVNIFSPLTDAIFQPPAAQQQVRARQANAVATANFTLLDVARLYVKLVGTQAAYEARKVTAADADRIANDVISFAIAGQGRRSDADRANTDRRLFQTEILRAEENMAVTSARLSELLNLDPSARLQPMAPAVVPIELVDPNTPVEQLILTALNRRPDLANRQALLAEAEYQVHREKARPFLPTVWVSFSGGAFGGGSNLVPPTFSAVAGRTDFDARAYWTLLNFGAGNTALIRQRKAQAGQAAAEQARVVNEIRLQVAGSRARSLALKNRIEVAQVRLRSAEEGFSQDQARLRESLAKPIEALDSLRLLSEARIAVIEAITDYNQNQFELFVALGSPPPL